MVLARYIGGCGTARCYCAIQPTGQITPCVYIGTVKLGHLRENRLSEIWDHPLCATISDRDNLGEHCRVCEFRAYCGGCRARALAYTGDILAGDPGCIHNLKLWNEIVASQAASQPLPIIAAGGDD